MHFNASLVLWIYIVLLFIGGLIGFLKADSTASLITASSFAAILILCNVNMFKTEVSQLLSTVVLVVLMLFFAFRLIETKKFMPNGLMSVLTLATLVVLHVFIH